MTCLEDYIPDDQIDNDVADPKDNCLTTMVDGEESITKLLVMHSNTEVLHEVLNALFEGELSDAVG